MEALDWLARHRTAALEDLAEFLRIPSISSVPEHRPDVARAARWLAARLERAGLTAVAVRETGGHPVVTARSPDVPGAPTILVYGHYDVQPTDPDDAWSHPPFDPRVAEGRIWARGASDDKGQVLMHVLAAEALGATGGIPLNLRFLFEGEEESGSVHLHEFVAAHREELQADAVVISDTAMFAAGVPAICYGLRGLAALDVTVYGPAQDLHSGVFGGAVANPVHELARLIAALHDPDGRVAVPGFYDGVREPTAAEREEWARLPFDEREFLRTTGSPRTFGEPGYTTLERIWARPTLEVNGIAGGFFGEGRKTIVPASATAKITCRLVPDQDPAAVVDAVVRFLESHCPDTVRLEVVRHEADPAVLTPLDHPVVTAARQALAETWGLNPVNIRMGGSIPVVHTFQSVLGAPAVLVGFSLPEERFHAPDEFFTLENFYRGTEALVRLWRNLAAHRTGGQDARTAGSPPLGSKEHRP
jgi:acetylornithine deacetylase/succinyl-diaminopimelate desuccinylase-like protein